MSYEFPDFIFDLSKEALKQEQESTVVNNVTLCEKRLLNCREKIASKHSLLLMYMNMRI